MIRFVSRLFFNCCLLTGALLCSEYARANALATAEWRYSVRPGESLVLICRKFLKESDQWVRVAKYNHLNFPDVLLAGQILRIPVTWLRQEPGTVSLVSSSGLVSVQHSTMEPFLPGQNGMQMASGARILTGSQSSGLLKFADGSLLFLQPLTVLALDAISVYAGGSMVDSSIRLQDGRIHVRANPFQRAGQRMEVTTPSAVAAVRGTEFWLQADSKRTLQQTFEGSVQISAGEVSVEVPGGFGNVVSLGNPPSEVIPLQSAPQTRLLPARLTKLPIVFELPTELNTPQWHAQILLDTPGTEIVRELSVTSPLFNWVSLPNGAYILKVQRVAISGLPGLPAFHKFEIAVPREKMGPAFKLHKNIFTNGPLDVKLPILPRDQAYLLQLTEDQEGKRVVWQTLSAQNELKISAPENTNDSSLHFLAWRYTIKTE